MQTATSLFRIIESFATDAVLVLTVFVLLVITFKSSQWWKPAPALLGIALLLLGNLLRQVTNPGPASALSFFVAFFVIPVTLLTSSTIMMLAGKRSQTQRRGTA